MARRSEHTQEQIKEMVLNAAEAIVVEEGFRGLTVRKIALDIGYTVGSIYMVYANMNDLITHIKGRTLDELAMQLAESQRAESVELQIQALAAIYLNFAANNFNRWRLIFEQPIDAQTPDWYLQKVEQLFAQVESLFQQLTPHKSAEDTQLAARSLWSGIHGVCILSLNGNIDNPGLAQARMQSSLLVSQFLRGWQLG